MHLFFFLLYSTLPLLIVQAVLESHHCATMFQILRRAKNNFLLTLPRETCQEVGLFIRSFFLSTLFNYLLLGAFDTVNEETYSFRVKLWYYWDVTTTLLNLHWTYYVLTLCDCFCFALLCCRFARRWQNVLWLPTWQYTLGWSHNPKVTYLFNISYTPSHNMSATYTI